METTQQPITELVQMRLTGSWSDYKTIFEDELLPLLCSAPGMVSVRTGPKLLAPHSQFDTHEIVSITQWRSLKAHGDFVKSARGQKFLQGAGAHMVGPPTVTHYDLGSLNSSDSWVVCSQGNEAASFNSDPRTVTQAGQEMKDKSHTMTLAFLSTEDALRHAIKPTVGAAVSFGVHVQSYREGQKGSRL
ncbi:hypothetical protein IQ07DRAFT_649119 [Pyrenochaeta sp. DS3sAY3a]|nr:hypothetical protein IQ07DRAFT_649119 [Pyrenochaeta sp. DS3sAY3a]